MATRFANRGWLRFWNDWNARDQAQFLTSCLLPIPFPGPACFVPDLLHAYGTDESIKLLAELSMFRLPYFAQKCLTNLESFGEQAVPIIDRVLHENPAFDELKGG